MSYQNSDLEGLLSNRLSRNGANLTFQSSSKHSANKSQSIIVSSKGDPQYIDEYRHVSFPRRRPT